MFQIIRTTLIYFTAALLILSSAHAETETRYSTVELISEQSSLSPSSDAITLALKIEPSDSYHTFWKNPGEATKALSIEWDLPAGFSANELEFPAPEFLNIGQINAYGYDAPAWFLTKINVPAELTEESYEFRAHARWEVCREGFCAPDRANLSVSVRVGDSSADSDRVALFERIRSELPVSADWPTNYAVEDGEVRFNLNSTELPDAVEGARFFVATPGFIIDDAPIIDQTGKALTVTLPMVPGAAEINETEAVLIYDDPERGPVALELSATKVATASASTANDLTAGLSSNPNSIGFFQAAIFAFFGGIILNLMPCVFPVLTIKALSLVKLGSANRAAAIESGVIYTIGILVAFAAIAAIMLSFRYAGSAVGWGFHLQNPLVVMSLGLLMVAIGLNLMGAFEIGTSVTGVGQELTQGGERRASFFTGLLAVVVATPCMAPFMAAALGYALTQPALVSVSVFLALGLGLAFPYLALSIAPGLGKVLPKPGAWMDVFKNVLAFPMFITALWLFWIVGRQLGATSMFVGLIAAVALGFALWAYGKSALASRKVAWYAVSAAGAAMTIYATSQVPAYKAAPVISGDISAGMLGDMPLERFDPDRVTQYVESGQPTFVYFTADWCISCKANERVALATDTVSSAFNKKGIKVIEGDWTTADQRITDWLAMYDRAGVPLYLYYPEGSTLETATILPQILTAQMVVEFIENADAAS